MDTPSTREGFKDTDVEYSNTASAIDMKLVVEASKLLALGDVESRVLARAILRKVIRDCKDNTVRKKAKVMLYQSKKVYPEIIAPDAMFINAAEGRANALGESKNFLVDLLYLEGFQEELRGYTESNLTKLVQAGIQKKVNSIVEDDDMDNVEKLRMLRDILFRIKHSFSVGKLIFRRLPRQRRILGMTYKKPLKALKKEIRSLVDSMRESIKPRNDNVTSERRLEILAEIYKAQALFDFGGIRNLWNIITRLNIFNPLWHTQNYRKKKVILKEINDILQPIKNRKEKLELKLEKETLTSAEEAELKKINSILDKYKDFNFYDELMALQRDYINFLRYWILAGLRKRAEKRRFKAMGENVRNSSQLNEHIRDIHNAFKHLLSVYKGLKSKSYQFYLRSSHDIFAILGFKSRWTVGNYANYALKAIQGKRERTTNLLVTISDTLETLGFTEAKGNLDSEITAINNTSLTGIDRAKALGRAIKIITDIANELLDSNCF